MYVFFVSVITVWSSEAALIFLNSILFDGKVNLIDAFGRSKFKILNGFQKSEKNKIKTKEKWEF